MLSPLPPIERKRLLTRKIHASYEGGALIAGKMRRYLSLRLSSIRLSGGLFSPVL
jgi:hypothetical protein